MDPDTQPGQQGRALACRAAREFNIPVQLAEILQKRGFDTLEALRDFLHPQLAMLPAPDTMKGMSEAVACLCEAYRRGQTIFVHGDYDADGITATALLLTDPEHAVPVQVARSGLRTIAFGTGRTDMLRLPNIPQSADIRVGDRVVVGIEHGSVLKSALRAYGVLLRDRHFLGLVFIGAFAMSGFFVYLAGSPFVLINHYGLNLRDPQALRQMSKNLTV